MKRKPFNTIFVLQHFLPYLTNRAGVKTGMVFSHDLRRFGVSLFEWRIMIALWGAQDLRLNDVAKIIVADLSTTSRQIRGLERSGLVARARSSADRRALSLVLTEKGRSITAEIIPVARMHEQVATQGLNPEDLAALSRSLVRIFDNLSAFEGSRRASGQNRRDR